MKKSISLNLGGGAARGYAHIGVLRCLDEFKIPFDKIIGVSSGSFAGSLYAMVPDASFVKERMCEWLFSEEVQNSVVMSYNKSEAESENSLMKKLNKFYTKSGVLGRILLNTGMLTLEDVEKAFFPFVPPIDIRNTRIPFACVAVNLKTGLSRIFEEGDLRQAVLASSALPMVMPPIEIEGDLYCDGGVLDKIGIDAAKTMGIDRVIAVDVSNESMEDATVSNGLDVLFRTEEISSNYRRSKQLNKADVLISPIEGNIHWADYSRINEIMDMGYEATFKKIDEIRSTLKLTSPFKKFFSIFNILNKNKDHNDNSLAMRSLTPRRF